MSFEFAAQVGIDLRNKRSMDRNEAVNEAERERPMSWEGELSDQEITQMDNVNRRLKTEQANEDDACMEDIQSVGPSSPQPMCTNADADLVRVPQVAPAAMKSEMPWEVHAKNDAVDTRLRPSPPLVLTQRPSFSESFTGHTPLASPLTSRHPIRLPLGASGESLLQFQCHCCRMFSFGDGVFCFSGSCFRSITSTYTITRFGYSLGLLLTDSQSGSVSAPVWKRTELALLAPSKSVVVQK